MRKKAYPIMIAQRHPAHLSIQSEQTFFSEKIISGEKIHTVLGNYALWLQRFERIKDGTACLSLRKWQGLPYRSKQTEIIRLDATHGIGIQHITGLKSESMYGVNVDGFKVDWTRIARNDGLTFWEFSQCFFWNPKGIDNGAIIHFTPFRYEQHD